MPPSFEEGRLKYIFVKAGEEAKPLTEQVAEKVAVAKEYVYGTGKVPAEKTVETGKAVSVCLDL